MKAKIYKELSLIAIMGFMYMGLELIWRGRTDISMWFVGGLCAYLIGRLNERDRFPNMKIWIQSILGVLITLFIEFISGMFLNVYLGLNVWDYSNEPYNIHGQICLPYAFLWFLLMPLAIYTDDLLRYKLFNEEKPNSIFIYYKGLIPIIFKMN